MQARIHRELLVESKKHDSEELIDFLHDKVMDFFNSDSISELDIHKMIVCLGGVRREIGSDLTSKEVGQYFNKIDSLNFEDGIDIKLIELLKVCTMMCCIPYYDGNKYEVAIELETNKMIPQYFDSVRDFYSYTDNIKEEIPNIMISTMVDEAYNVWKAHNDDYVDELFFSFLMQEEPFAEYMS